jgi:glycosyltransferase involved in cell wall biosynthesis
VQPLVSILIPAYNAEQWIGDTLRSAVAQTWPRKEIIVVDDGSRDGTLAAARKFEGKDFLVTTQQNQGAAATRNRAFSLCQGDFIQWLDADDLLAPDKIERQMAARDTRKSERTLLSGPWGSFLYRPYKAAFTPTPLWADLPPAEWLSRKMGQNLHMQTGTWLVARALTEAAGPWNTKLLGDDDGEYFCRVLLASDGVRFVPEAKVYYRASGSSSLSYIGRSAQKMDAQWTSMQLHVRYLLSLEDSRRTREVSVRYLQTWFAVFYPGRPDLVEQVKELARSLGGELKEPTLSWKYAWIKALFGWGLAKRAQVMLPATRWSVQRSWDKAIYRWRPTE